MSMWMVTMVGQNGNHVRALVAAKKIEKALRMAKHACADSEPVSVSFKHLGPLPDLVVGFEEQVV